ncbi:MAG: hypothetical protein ACR2KV_16305 [Solirubrobacteraceae bacterium]
MAEPPTSAPHAAGPGPRPGAVRSSAPPAESAAAVWTATGLEPQIFLDRTGRRARRVQLAGAGVGLLSAGWLAALVTGSIGFSGLPILPATVLAGRPPISLIHVAAAQHSRHPASEATTRGRRRVVETAAVPPPGPTPPAGGIDRTQTGGLAGTIR